MSPRAVVSVREGEEVAAVSQEPRKWGEREGNFLFAWSSTWIRTRLDGLMELNRIICCKPVTCLVFRFPSVELKCEGKRRRKFITTYLIQ